MNRSDLQEEFLSQLHIGHLKSLYEYMPDIYFFAKNRNEKFVMANQIFVNQCGAEHEQDIIGKTDHDFFPKDRADSYIQDDQYPSLL